MTRGRSAAARVAAVRPAYFVGGFVVAQWAMTAVLASAATHNGWLYYHGGDGTYYWTTTWSLAHHRIPEAVISYGLPVFLWPLALVFGASMLAGLKGVVLLQAAILAPAGVIAMYALAARIGGRLFGYLAVSAWIAMPAFSLWFFDSSAYPSDEKIRDLVLPNALGLTNLGDYASMILALLATYFVVRALDERRWDDVVFAGLATGTMIAVKPSNGYFVIAPALAFAVCRRWREGLAFAALIAPVVLTLAIWKKIGLGYIPAASSPPSMMAYGGAGGPLASNVDQYFPFDWHTLSHNLWELRGTSRSFWLLEWLTIGGLIGLARRAPVPAVAIGGWFVEYLLFKGGASGRSSVDSTTFYRLVMPAFPAFVLIVVSTVFLFPTIKRRRIAPARPSPPTRVAVVAVVVLLAYPLAFVSTARAWSAGHVVHDSSANLLVPVSGSLRPDVRVGPDAVTLSWNAVHGPSRVYYRVYRSTGSGCVERTRGARDCELDPTTAGETSRPRFVDRGPPSGPLVYRIGLVAGWRRDAASGDLLMVGPPVSVPSGMPDSS